ncbi:signal peptidase I [Bariatricus massiliensis]|uniref:Signal peptidase I n=1 Tax=Bariatricus massiliensis TaxID=1745713 RepID=A0ABS8DKV0_9FIRM|nr:signal peptidase I [Bariatricus massiliensis]MCB7305932.1 signal peptidase I [Bariatricus massiliensis]MCB7376478.1 signal peptidase I [Bariatricus massiliensis]MCB7389075.1 signal peptidase I [Bariatricus massiliensis]MCB7413248.1 signal peptidase I [Bariatricus massiliensis]MCQ5255145.1 signal peptidase I [Bariatricus massiliensis]
MKKLMNKIVNFIFGLIVLVLIVCIIGIQFFPDELNKYIGYRTFVILTDSMEPTIPVGSLVISKKIDNPENIKVNTIISFRVDRFGDDTVFTHYFKKRQIDETGRERYFTIAENADRYDDYVTYREDVLGTYVFHVPYIGKFVLFLQSPFALIELGIILFILLINRLLWDKFDREEKEALESDENDEDVIDAEEIHEIDMDVESEDIQQPALEDSGEVSEVPDEKLDTVTEQEATVDAEEQEIPELPSENEEVAEPVEEPDLVTYAEEEPEKNTEKKSKHKKSGKKQKKEKKKKKGSNKSKKK